MNNRSFTLMEALIYLFVFSLLSGLIISFSFWLFNYNSESRERTESLLEDNASLDFILETIRSADSIYYPTVDTGQLSLAMNNTYLDLYLCGENLCLKEEFKDPVAIASDIDLNFQLIGERGVKINLNELTTTIFLR